MQAPSVYKISSVSGVPNFDSVPVAKIVDYPLEQRDYRPFAQCILCRGGDSLFLRLWAFEVSPLPSSTLVCVFYPFPGQPDGAVRIAVEHGDGHQVTPSLSLWKEGAWQPCDHTLATHPHNGEDLQGVYWGMTIDLPLSVLEGLGAAALQPGDSFPGNFYKTCEHPQSHHLGSYFPAQFPDAPYSRDSMGVFQVVAY